MKMIANRDNCFFTFTGFAFFRGQGSLGVV